MFSGIYICIYYYIYNVNIYIIYIFLNAFHENQHLVDVQVATEFKLHQLLAQFAELLGGAVVCSTIIACVSNYCQSSLMMQCPKKFLQGPWCST